jgi:hypothetical protein
MKKNLNEEVSRIKDMMKRIDESHFDWKEGSDEQQLQSIHGLLKFATQTKDWAVVEQSMEMLQEYMSKENMGQDNSEIPGFEGTRDALDDLSIRDNSHLDSEGRTFRSMMDEKDEPQNTKKRRLYYHVLEYGSYGEIGWQGVYSTQQEAEERAKKLKEFFPKNDFQVFTDTSKKEPPITTV